MGDTISSGDRPGNHPHAVGQRFWPLSAMRRSCSSSSGACTTPAVLGLFHLSWRPTYPRRIDHGPLGQRRSARRTVIAVAGFRLHANLWHVHRDACRPRAPAAGHSAVVPTMVVVAVAGDAIEGISLLKVLDGIRVGFHARGAQTAALIKLMVLGGALGYVAVVYFPLHGCPDASDSEQTYSIIKCSGRRPVVSGGSGSSSDE